MASTVTPLPTGAGPARTRLPAERAARAGHRRRDRRCRGHGPAELPGLRLRRARPRQRAGLRAVAPLAGHAGTARRGRRRGVGGEPAQHPAVDRSASGTDAIDVFTDPTRTTGAVDPYSRERYIGLGCALENLVLACGPRGLRPRSRCCPTGPAVTAWRTSRCPSRSPDDEPLVRGDRRAAHQPGPLHSRRGAAEVLAGLSRRRTCRAGSAVQWIAEPGAEGRARRPARRRGRGAGRRRAAVGDNFAWFRRNNDADQRHRDGLVLDGQGLGPFTLGVAKLLPASSRTAGDRFWVDKTRDRAHRDRRGLRGDHRRTPRRPPRASRRRTPAAEHPPPGPREGVALQHMNQITERIDRETSTGAPATFAPRFAALLPAGARPLLTFRVGYPVRAGRPTPRRSAAMVLR